MTAVEPWTRPTVRVGCCCGAPTAGRCAECTIRRGCVLGEFALVIYHLHEALARHDP